MKNFRLVITSSFNSQTPLLLIYYHIATGTSETVSITPLTSLHNVRT